MNSDAVRGLAATIGDFHAKSQLSILYVTVRVTAVLIAEMIESGAVDRASIAERFRVAADNEEPDEEADPSGCVLSVFRALAETFAIEPPTIPKLTLMSGGKDTSPGKELDEGGPQSSDAPS